ncbi:hypothetical protein [Synergistes jonesii]|uniref:hypothetical protein n=1 Tax=Synergistes jonesii TaxID=2754 RepID=UPI00248E9222|nr:hypothetical protein [Synergistes jonesii]
MLMKLFQICLHCGASVTDPQILRLLEVYPVNCPVCGKTMRPQKLELKNDAILELEEEELVGNTLPEGFTDTLGIGGHKNV